VGFPKAPARLGAIGLTAVAVVATAGWRSQSAPVEEIMDEASARARDYLASLDRRSTIGTSS